MGRELAAKLILSSDDLLSQLAEMMHLRAINSADADSLFLPCGFDIRAILNGSDVEAIDQVFKSYDVLLSQKARTVGLARIERYLKTDSIDDG